MPVPNFQQFMLPVLETFADGREHSLADAAGPLATNFHLTEAEVDERVPSGQSRFRNRLAWAHNYLKQAGLLESPGRGRYRITQRGREALSTKPVRIDAEFLEQYPEFREFRERSATTAIAPESSVAAPNGIEAELTPDEQVRLGAARHRSLLAGSLLQRAKQVPPAFFESLVVRLLVAMGYGGSHEDAAKVVGRSGDGGIDGIIKEDRLGLDSIYVQAKRWEAAVGRPVVQQFAGRAPAAGIGCITAWSFGTNSRRW